MVGVFTGIPSNLADSALQLPACSHSVGDRKPQVVSLSSVHAQPFTLLPRGAWSPGQQHPLSLCEV